MENLNEIKDLQYLGHSRVTWGLQDNHRDTMGIRLGGETLWGRGNWVPSRVLQLFPINLRVSFINLLIY